MENIAFAERIAADTISRLEILTRKSAPEDKQFFRGVLDDYVATNTRMAKIHRECRAWADAGLDDRDQVLAREGEGITPGSPEAYAQTLKATARELHADVFNQMETIEQLDPEIRTELAARFLYLHNVFAVATADRNLNHE